MNWLKMLAIAGMNGGGSGGSGGVSPEEVTTIVKEQFPGGVGYSEVVEVGGDTLTWDFNAAGKLITHWEAGGVDFCHISDAVITKVDVANGFSVIMTLQTDNGPQVQTIEVPAADAANMCLDDGFISLAESFVYVPTDGYNGNGVIYEKAGVWAMYMAGVPAGTAFDLIIPGYTGFKTVTKTVKTIDPKFLPESHQFGKDRAFEPIVWDGNTEGLESFTIPANEDTNRLAIVLYKVMDKYIPITDSTDIESFSIISSMGGEEQTVIFTPEYVQQMGEEDFAIVTEHGCVCGGYIVISDGNLQYPDSLVTVPYGVWFCYQIVPEIGMTAYAKDILPVTTINPISAEYLPNVADIPETWIADLKAALGI